MTDHIRPKLKPHGLGWVDFQMMRATHASIGHRLALNPKVTADQRGHGVGVSIAEYTKTSLKDRQSQLGSWKTLLWAEGGSDDPSEGPIKVDVKRHFSAARKRPGYFSASSPPAWIAP